MPAFTLDETENKIWGCGRFVVDSYKIFCRSEGTTLTPDDATLHSFVRWLRCQPSHSQEAVPELHEEKVAQSASEQLSPVDELATKELTVQNLSHELVNIA